MASNALANAAAAVTAGYAKTNTDRGTGGIGAGGAPVYPASERFQTIFSKDFAGASGEPGVSVSAIGYGVDQNTAELQALANLNSWRANRYGSDSTATNTPITDRTTVGQARTKTHTKDST